MVVKKMRYNKEFLDWWYNRGGWRQTIYGLEDDEPAVAGQITKAVTPWDPPAAVYDYYFESVFSATVQAWVDRASEVFKLLPKTTWLAEGDSLKYYAADLAGLTGVSSASTPFASITVESGPTVATLEQLKPAYVIDPWETGLTSRVESTWQRDPKLDQAWVKQYHVDNLPNQIDNMLIHPSPELST